MIRLKGYRLPPVKAIYYESLALILLLVFSLAFAKARIINSDSAFYFFKLVNSGHFNIEQGRYAAAVTQVPLLLGIRAGISLKTLVYIYSASFVILQWLIYLVIRFGLKNSGAALLLVLTLTTGVSHSLYLPVSELTQGMAWAILLFAILYSPVASLRTRRGKIASASMAFATVFLCFFSHPLTVFPVLYVTGFYLTGRQSGRNYLPWLLVVFTILLFSLKTIALPANSYEAGKLGLLNNFRQNLPHFFSLYSTQYLILRWYKLYLVSFFFFVVMNLYYLRKREFLKWALMNGFIVAFLVVHNLIYFSGGSAMEMDKNLVVLNFLIFLPVVKDFPYEKILYGWRKTAAFAFLILFSAVMILHPAPDYTGRIKYLERLNDSLVKKEHRKFYTEETNLDRDSAMFLWSVPFESLIISSLNGPGHSRTLYPYGHDHPLPPNMGDPDLFICVYFWPDWRVDQLDPRYFRLPAEAYVHL